MGTWDTAPWGNDSAADWYADLFEKTGLAKEVEEALNLNVNDRHDEIRAAAALVVLLGRTYIWPVYDLDRHLALAADKLEEVSRVDVIAESPEIVQQIRAEIEELRSRIHKPGQSTASAPSPNPPEDSRKRGPKKWWEFWK